jgi:hypothetical protein
MNEQDRQTIQNFLDTLSDTRIASGARSTSYTVSLETDTDTIASTDGKGNIALSASVAASLSDGLRRISNNRPLAINHEKAFASLQHELLHNQAKGLQLMRSEYAKGRLVEAVNELLSRHTYTKLIEQAGGVAQFKDEIIKNGDGYIQTTRNLQRLLQHLGLTWSDIEKDAQEALLVKPYEELTKNIAVVLAQKSRREEIQIRRALSKIDLDAYAQFLDNILPLKTP